MKSAGFLALALTGALLSGTVTAAPRQGANPNLYVRESQGVPRSVMGQDGNWQDLGPDAYPRGDYGYGGPDGAVDPRYGGPQARGMMEDPYSYGQGPGGPGQGVPPGGPGGMPPGAGMPPDGGIPPEMGPPPGVGGPPPVAGYPPPPPVARRGGCGRVMVYGGRRFCRGPAVVVQEEGYEEVIRIYRPAYEPISPFGPPY